MQMMDYRQGDSVPSAFVAQIAVVLLLKQVLSPPRLRQYLA